MKTIRIFLLSCITAMSVAQAQNLINDGTFSTTSPTFTSDFINNCGMSPGLFCIASNGWQPGDHSTPSDNVLQVDGSKSKNTEIIWSQNITGLAIGSQYNGSFWCRPRTTSHDVEIDVRINGNLIGHFSSTGSHWQQFSYTFQNTLGTTITLELVQTKFGDYTDSDLDDFEFFKTWPIEVNSQAGSDLRVVWAAGNNLCTTEEYIYTAGDMVGTADFEGTTHTSTSTDWLPWLAQYDHNKHLQWIADIQGTSSTTYPLSDQYGVTGIDADASGNVYITGFYRNGSITFDQTTTLTNTNNVWNSFIAKFDAGGTLVWATQLKGNGGFVSDVMVSTLGGVKVDKNGLKIYVAGTLSLLGTPRPYDVYLPPNVYTVATGLQSGFIAQFDAATGSNLAFNYNYDCTIPSDLEIDGSNAYVCGMGAMAPNLPFVAKVNITTSSPYLNWSTINLGSVPGTQSNKVKARSLCLVDDHVYVVGDGFVDFATQTNDAICFNGFCTNVSSHSKAWIAKFSKTSMQCSDLAEISGASTVSCHDIEGDQFGNIYVSGVTNSASTYFKNRLSVTLNVTSLTAGGISDIYLAKYANDLNSMHWTHQHGGNQSTLMPGSICYDQDHETVYFSGFHEIGTVNVGPGAVSPPVGNGDYFIARKNQASGISYKKQPTSLPGQPSNSTTFELFPNPSSGSIFIGIPSDLNADCELTIYDMLGNEVFNATGLKAGYNEYDISTLNAGSYIYQLKSRSGENFQNGIVSIQH